MNLTYKSPSLKLSGAIAPAEGELDQGVPWHYGDPLREQKYLSEAKGLVDLSHYGVIEITGEDRLTFLHSLTSAHILRGKPTESLITLLLSPHGHIEHLLKVIFSEAALWIIVEPTTKEKILSYFRSMIFMSRVEINEVSDKYAVLAEPIRSLIPNTPTWLTPENYENLPIKDAGFSAGGDPNKYLKTRPATFAAREFLIPREELESHLKNAEYLVGTWALNALRIAAGVVREGVDFDHKTLPHEVGLIGNAVHLEKGCYRGQETVARVHNLGRPPRKLVLLHLDGLAERLPKLGSEVTEEDKVIGIVGSAVRHFEFGPIALALVKAKTHEGIRVVIDSIAGSLQEIVTTEPNTVIT
jgi:folate-binding protein YgfZ